MPKFDGFICNKNLRKKEFDTAIAYFQKNISVKKWSKRDNDLGNSYIRMPDGTVFALSSNKLGGSVLGLGASGRVKLAMNSKDELYAIKIESTNLPFQEKENLINQNLKLATHPKIGIPRPELGIKYYTPMRYLGISLNRILFDIEKPYKASLARKIAWELHKLHSGALSEDHIGYAHLDLKPDNIVVNIENKVSLIDYGSAHLLNEKYDEPIISTVLYAPLSYDEIINSKSKEEKEEELKSRLAQLGPIAIDVIALKKILHFPFKGSEENAFCIYSEEEFNDFPPKLKAMIDTADIPTCMSRKDEDTPLNIAIAFLALETGLEIDADSLSIEQKEQLCVMSDGYLLPLSEDDDDVMQENQKTMRDEAERYYQGIKPGSSFRP